MPTVKGMLKKWIHNNQRISSFDLYDQYLLELKTESLHAQFLNLYMIARYQVFLSRPFLIL